jgi:hypothetical protein
MNQILNDASLGLADLNLADLDLVAGGEDKAPAPPRPRPISTGVINSSAISLPKPAYPPIA